MLETVGKGLGDYQIYKTGFTVLIIICFLYCAIGLTMYNYSLNYVSTPGNITLNLDKTEILTYVVNNKTYTKIIQPITTNKNNVIITTPAYMGGPCTVYYPSANPDSFSVNTNPTFVTSICTAVLCCISCCSILWLLFLRSNREVASVMGGLDVANTVINMAKR